MGSNRKEQSKEVKKQRSNEGKIRKRHGAARLMWQSAVDFVTRIGRAKQAPPLQTAKSEMKDERYGGTEYEAESVAVCQ
jgi:hypothetical protein